MIQETFSYVFLLGINVRKERKKITFYKLLQTNVCSESFVLFTSLVKFIGLNEMFVPCVSRIVAFMVKNIDTIIFLHVSLVNSILHVSKFRKKLRHEH